MEIIGYFSNLVLLLPWYVTLPPLFIFGVFLILDKLNILVKKGLVKKKLSQRQLLATFFLILLVSLAISFISLLPKTIKFNKKEEKLNKRISELEIILSKCIQGVSVKELPNEEEQQEVATIDCEGWDSCTDFRSDFRLDNKYYTHTNEDPQKLILEGGPFPNPPLYFDKDCSPFYSFRLEVVPLNTDAANIIIESKGMFQLFIGDSDYRSLGFLKWNQRDSTWTREVDSKIYFGGDLDSPDMEPKTQFSINVETKKKGDSVEAEFKLTYKSVEGEKKVVTFIKEINLPAAEPEKILTRVGTGMYRSKGIIPQAKFYFMGLRER